MFLKGIVKKAEQEKQSRQQRGKNSLIRKIKSVSYETAEQNETLRTTGRWRQSVGWRCNEAQGD